MRYRDLMTAIKWLEEAFGFEKQVAVSDADGNVIYAQMTYGAGMIMLGGVRDTDLDKLMRQPDEVGGIETQSVYAVVADADIHYARAKKAGADIVLEIKSDGFGRRGYSCRDPQGHIWNFGTYNPVKGLLTPPAPPSDVKRPEKARRQFSALAAAMALALVGAWWWTDGFGTGPSAELNASANYQAEQDIARLKEEVAKLRNEKHAAEDTAATAKEALDTERKQRTATETALSNERTARTKAEADAIAALNALTGERRAKDEAVKALDQAKPQRSSALESTPGSDLPPAMQETSALPDPETKKSERPQSTIRRPPMRLSARPRRNAFIPYLPNTYSTRRKPTYLVDMADVPWPYSTWYRKKRR
jgi:uncharacterized glyoxalase superfamily protein PhnB